MLIPEPLAKGSPIVDLANEISVFTDRLTPVKSLKPPIYNITFCVREEKWAKLIEMKRLFFIYTALLWDENSIFLYQASIVSLGYH